MQSNSNTILINTEVPFVNIYAKTLSMPFLDECNANNSLLLNGLYLTIRDMVLKMIQSKTLFIEGGQRKSKYPKTKTIQKRGKRIGKGEKKRKRKTRKMRGGNKNKNKNWISKLIFSLMAIVLLMSKNVFGVHPEYDNDVMRRLINAGEIKELFENKHGTCTINSALFLGSINLQTYAEVSEKIIKRGHGLSFSEATSYLSSSLNTLWEWETISNNELNQLNQKPLRKLLRGSLERQSQSQTLQQKREKINRYIQTLKNQLIQIRNNMSHPRDTTQGILTAMSYPSESVQHAVVAWLTSDETFVIIDPQEFMQGKVVLYVDELSKLSALPHTFLKMGLDDYFMKYLDERENGMTFLLRDMHIRKEEHLEEMVRENPMINEVIEKMKMLSNT